ncbi:MAG: glycosyltransferase [Chitinophagaceae bacterium]|nr:glycosyltransferase [Chitinophagaceae bacterium]
MNTPVSKKVLFVIDTLQLGGAEQSLLENTSRFKDILPVVCHLYSGEILQPKFVERGIKVYSFNISKKYGFLEAYKKLKEVVQKEQPDLMVAYLTRSEIVTRLIGRFNHIPVVGTFVNDLYCKSYNQHLSWKAKSLVSVFKYINKATSKICVGFVSNSEAIKEANAKHLSISPEKIKVINRGRDSFKFLRKNIQSQKSGNPIRFLNVSRLFPVKGHRYMILGFKKFLHHYPDASLSIVGDGPLRNELQKLINDNMLKDKVFLLGSRNDVPALLSQYDCFIFPSLVEGFSGAVVEAMFAGLPILASDIAQNKEAVIHLETGYLFGRESVEEVEKAMLWYKENTGTANVLAMKAYDYAKENFELDKIVDKFEGYLQDIIIKSN